MNGYTKWCEIDVDALKYNISNIRKLVGEEVKLAAVVKANGYGHGSLEIMEHLAEAGADVIIVSSVYEAVEMRKKYKLPILVLGVAQVDRINSAILNDITLTVVSEDQAEDLSASAMSLGKTLNCHIKIDTGMSRIGFRVNEADAESVVRISRLPGLNITGIFSHFATADEEDSSFTEKQFDEYKKMLSMLEAKGLFIPVKHIANSAAIMEYPETHLDMVRSGIITYGLYPSHEVNKSKLELRPAMSLRARISLVKTTTEEVGVSYGLTERVGPGTVLATLPVGYADGYFRANSGISEVIIKGKRAKIVGRVCMDQLMVDVTHIEGVKAGDIATFFGSDGEEILSVDELAENCNTINYELICAISRRVPRIYLKNGKVIGVTDYLL